MNGAAHRAGSVMPAPAPTRLHRRSRPTLQASNDPMLDADVVLLSDGSRVGIRPIRPGDRAALATAFDRLSPQSRRNRFLVSKPRMSSAELTYCTEVDHSSHEALVAFDVSGDRLLGVARYAGSPESPGAAELALTVADDWQRRGLGTELAHRALASAQRNGIRRLRACSLATNAAADRVLEALGFRRISSTGTTIDYELVIGYP